MRVDEVQHNDINFTFSYEVFWIFLTPLNAASVINIPRTTRLSKVSPAVIENPMLLSKSSVLQTKPNSLQMRSARQIIFLQQLLPKQFTHVMHSFMICCGSQISTISCPLPFSPSTNVQLFCHFHSLWSVFIFSKKKKLSHKQPHTPCCYALALMSCCDGRERGAFQELHIVLMLSIFHTLNNG